MVRMSVYYPNQTEGGGGFDHAYYADAHRRLVEQRLGPLGLQRFEIDRGLAGYGGAPAPYTAVGHLLFDSLDALQRAWDAAGTEILADLPRFTSLQPLVQISEIVPA